MTSSSLPNTALDIVRSDIHYIVNKTTNELDHLAGQKILFTGGAGFLGYLFINLLAQVGESDNRRPVELTVYENFSRGSLKDLTICAELSVDWLSQKINSQFW